MREKIQPQVKQAIREQFGRIPEFYLLDSSGIKYQVVAYDQANGLLNLADRAEWSPSFFVDYTLIDPQSYTLARRFRFLREELLEAEVHYTENGMVYSYEVTDHNAQLRDAALRISQTEQITPEGSMVIQVESTSELAKALDDTSVTDLFLEKDGVRYRVSKYDEGIEHLLTEDWLPDLRLEPPLTADIGLELELAPLVNPKAPFQRLPKSAMLGRAYYNNARLCNLRMKLGTLPEMTKSSKEAAREFRRQTALSRRRYPRKTVPPSIKSIVFVATSLESDTFNVRIDPSWGSIESPLGQVKIGDLLTIGDYPHGHLLSIEQNMLHLKRVDLKSDRIIVDFMVPYQSPVDISHQTVASDSWSTIRSICPFGIVPS